MLLIEARQHADDAASSPFSSIYPYASEDLDLLERNLRNRLYYLGGFDEIALTVIFVPSLPHGEMRSLPPEQDRRVVSIGLSQHRFQQQSPLDRRQTLVNSVLSALTGMGMRASLAKVKEAYRAEYESLLPQETSSIPLRPDLYDKLVSACDHAAPGWEPSLLADLVTALNRTGRQFSPFRARRFGPCTNAFLAWQTTELGTGVSYSFIPSTTYSPGYDDAELELLASLSKQLSLADEAEQEERFDLEAFSQKDKVHTPPFLISCKPLLPTSISLQRVLSEIECPFLDVKQETVPVIVNWYQAWLIAQKLGCSVPCSAEAEAAIKGGMNGLFYWGNTPNDVILTTHSRERRRVDQRRERSWHLIKPYCSACKRGVWPIWNRFGLYKPLSFRFWCQPLFIPDSLTALRTRGGASGAWPWQGCGEWMYFLTGYEERHPVDENDSATLRLVLRFSKDSTA
jgi:hypothetical protein